MLRDRKSHLAGALAAAVLSVLLVGNARPAAAADPLDPATLTKYVDPLPIPGVVQSVGMLGGYPYYEVTMTQFTQQLHSELPPTTVWGYHGTYPGPTFEARRGKPIYVRWINNLPMEHLFTVDTGIHGAEYPENPYVRTVVHLHGGNVPHEADGYPTEWFTPGQNDLNLYPNRQRATTLWYHDHALGITRLNVAAGLAGFYLIREPWERGLNLPSGPYEIPIVIQDRTFDVNGQLMYPYPWEPEFFGNTAVVNGKVWPRLVVEPRKYRFRFLNGSNARFYNLKLFESDTEGNMTSTPGPAFYQIGTDGGYLSAPVMLNDPGNPFSPRLLFGSGERADLVIDFAGYEGKYFVLHNNAKAPFKGLDAPEEDEAPLSEIMLFEVSSTPVVDNSSLPEYLREVEPLNPYEAVMTRDLTLEELLDAEGNPIAALLNGMMFHDPITEKPRLGTTEIWRIINLTEDVHPIHLHLVQFQILDRQPFDVEHYMATKELVFTGPPEPPAPSEQGWKDTHQDPPGYVTRIIARFRDFPGLFVWHCHILEHEDNEMMRPYEVIRGVKPLVPITQTSSAPNLEQNYPNPFNPTTDIRYSLATDAQVNLVIYNILGQKVRELVNAQQPAGWYTAHWDGKDELGRPTASGIYFARLVVGDFVDTKRMLLVK